MRCALIIRKPDNRADTVHAKLCGVGSEPRLHSECSAWTELSRIKATGWKAHKEYYLGPSKLNGPYSYAT